ncbi:MAG: hypothetical protein AB7N80_13255 [Bdellovibrionales bacterium]
MFTKYLKVVVSIAVLGTLNAAHALSEHEEEVVKFYPGPVSAAEAFADLEHGVSAKLKEVCGDKGIGVIKSLTFEIPFDVSGGTTFLENGAPGSIQNPMFVYYSYPTVSARIRFTCD